MGFCQPSSYRCRRCRAAASAVRACVALLSIMSIIRGPILISSVSLPVAILASAMYGVFFLRGPVLRLVSSYVSTLFRFRAPASTAAVGPGYPPLTPLVGAVALVARTGAVLVGFVSVCVQVCGIGARAFSDASVRVRSSCAVVASLAGPCRSRASFAALMGGSGVGALSSALPVPVVSRSACVALCLLHK